MTSADSFDARFYERFYENPKTRVTSREEMEARARAVAAAVRLLDVPVRTILDAGCGLGWMRRGLLKQFPRARYVGLEVSEHLCRRYGWTHASLATYSPGTRFDLIVCYDVLQYLPDSQAVRAMANLARLASGALYFHAPTVEDWRGNADLSCSDGDIHLRPADWYRSRLARKLHYAGFGIHVKRGVPFSQWALEAPG
jgi:predicted TPR repeat methyltransferase